ncbi:MAG: hypothetical protein ACT4NJ_03485 [Nitrosopumilaceae archaeon]
METPLEQNQCQATKPVVPESVVNRAEKKVWRVSHSYNSVKNLRSAVKAFNHFMSANEFTWDRCVENPVTSFDDFVGWLDSEGKMPKSIRVYVGFLKRVMKEGGAKFTSDEFKDGVVLPKTRPFEDDKVNKDQIRRIILTLKHEGLKTLLMIEKDTQARPAEILTLKVRNFNLAHDPPYFNIEAENAKNDWPRELFFTSETKEFVMQRIEQGELKPNDFLFLNRGRDELDEEKFQKYVAEVRSQYSHTLREVIEKKIPELDEEVSGNRSLKRYKIHLYSFKKFAFTTMADELGEMASRAIKGDKEYVMTYYRKSREERAQDYRKVTPKLLVFAEEKDARQEIEDKIRTMSKDDLSGLLEFLKNGKNQPSESSTQTNSKTISGKATDSEQCYQKTEFSSKMLPVGNSTGSFNKIANLIHLNV